MDNSNLTDAEKEFLDKQLKKFQDQTKSQQDVSGDTIGTSQKPHLKLDKIDGSLRLSYYQVKQYYQNLIMKTKGGEM